MRKSTNSDAPLDPAPKRPEQLIDEAIETTGFVLENLITETLAADGWTTIPNRYYIDDASSSVREIDLIAYRASGSDDILCYTALIISCKKSSKNFFSFFTRDKKENDPNVDWDPVKIWTNNKALSYYFRNDNSADWVAHCKSTPAYNDSLWVRRQMFASQEIDKKTGKVDNDTNIFNSISSLMKAQHYEIKSLNNGRAKKQCAYSIHLITIADTEMYTAHFSDGKRVVSPMKNENFVYNYIVGSSNVSSQIRFAHKDEIKSISSSYRRYHTEWTVYALRKIKDFYGDILGDRNHFEKRAYVYPDFEKELFTWIGSHLEKSEHLEKPYTWIQFNAKRNMAEILIESKPENVDDLNNRSYVRGRVGMLLKEHFHYSGDFEFVATDPPPF